jgi:hypothetical protein
MTDDEPGIERYQAHESTGPSFAPGGAAGEAGCPEHHAPEQGREGRGRAGGTDRRASPPESSTIDESSEDKSPARSLRVVTRWEHSPRALGDALTTIAKRATAAGRETRSPNETSFVIR